MKPQKLKSNFNLAYVGVQPNAKGFVLSFEEAEGIIRKNPKNKECLKIFMVGKDLNQGWTWSGSRMIIDFQDWPLEKALEYKECFEIVKNKVKPTRIQKIVTTQHVAREKKYWWLFRERQPKMRQQLKPLKQFIATSMISKHRLFTMIQQKPILPANRIIILASSSFSFLGILSSKLHIVWAKYQGSKLEDRLCYTNTTCFETFPFPCKLKGILFPLNTDLGFL